MNVQLKPVLIVEDENDIRENMVMLLEDEGYLVYSAVNGKEAMSILLDPKTVLPGLVALDFYIPVMDARGFLEAFSEGKVRHHGLANITILLVTAADAQARAGLEGKTVGVLKKPIDIEQFLKIVQKYCGAA